MEINLATYNRTKYAETHKCQWCGERFDSSECEYEASFGWLCEQCVNYLRSCGEQMLIVHN